MFLRCRHCASSPNSLQRHFIASWMLLNRYLCIQLLEFHSALLCLEIEFLKAAHCVKRILTAIFCVCSKKPFCHFVVFKFNNLVRVFIAWLAANINTCAITVFMIYQQGTNIHTAQCAPWAPSLQCLGVSESVWDWAEF